MAVSFNYIPAGNGVRVPLFYAEMDNSQAGYFSQPVRSLLIGQKLVAGTALASTPYLVSTTAQAIALFGRGSMLARMHAVYRMSDPTGEVWCMAAADAGAGVAATGTITVTGPATAAGTINLYIGAQNVQVAVGSTDAANTIATNINTAINAALDLGVTSTVATNVVTMTCRWKGTTGNDILVIDSFRGTAGGESLPAGVALAYVAMASGATNPTLTTLITAMGDDPYDFVIHPYTDSTSLDVFATEYGDASGRWSWSRQIYGHCYSALRGALGALVTAGGLRNDPHHTIAAIDVDCPHPAYEYAAAYGARNAVYIAADPARPTQTGQLTGLIAPRPGKKFIWTERNSLLTYGIATSFVVSGVIQIERAITTYQKNTFGQADPSYLDSETLHTAAYVLRYLSNAITSKYARHKLANDGTRYGAGNAVVTPSVIRSEVLAAYDVLENLGIVENKEAFAAHLIVERDTLNPSRVNVLFPPDYINGLRIFAVLNQFRLQY
ncbi:MAG: phage tail sheath subtilisin-like domain-containing protein [Negativicutes bacterium]|jgi:phage tail sheath gpL-like